MFDLPMNRVMIAVAVAFGLVAMLRYVMTRHPKVETDPEGETGLIAPNRALLAVISLIGTFLAGAALYSWAYVGSGPLVLAVAIAALLMTAMMITSFFPFFDIQWDEHGIEGPTLLLPPPFGPRRIRIFWEDLEKAGSIQGRHWYLEDQQGKRIVWSFIYYGYPALMKRVEEECPWLFAEEEEEPPASKAAAKTSPAEVVTDEPPPQKRRLRLNFKFAGAKSA